MKLRLSNPVLADRGCRLAGIGFAERLVPRLDIKAPSQETRPAAGALDLPAPAAFSRYTETCPVAPVDGQDKAAPDVPTPASGAVAPLTRTSHALHLPEHVMVLVRAIAAYERCSNERAAMLALAEYAQQIGAGPLARAVFDLSEGGP
ncbi:hypothetical protein [Mesorhizobium muleiense]|uniref:hypothetical protein n=1 Tax=Mesorhizobium muleiense TaxID=1004279 RepID=UPI001F256E1F|nr:hypothetical protein [Mesorhizobium muleiense]MCF6111971.1 hypothetical protein [Mesorhizobium muleiense]